MSHEIKVKRVTCGETSSDMEVFCYTPEGKGPFPGSFSRNTFRWDTRASRMTSSHCKRPLNCALLAMSWSCHSSFTGGTKTPTSASSATRAVTIGWSRTSPPPTMSCWSEGMSHALAYSAIAGGEESRGSERVISGVSMPAAYSMVGASSCRWARAIRRRLTSPIRSNAR